MEKEKINVVVLDDHPVVRNGLQYALLNEKDISLVGLYGKRRDAMPSLAQGGIDVLILDYLLGDDDMDGLHLIKHIRSHFPFLKILVSSSVESPAIVQLVMKAGVYGYVGKSQDLSILIQAIRIVGKGMNYITPDIQLELDKFLESDKEMHFYVEPRSKDEDIKLLMRDLSPKEMEVLHCYLEGMTIMQIAAKFSRSRKTISGQKQSALRKLGLRSDLELFKYKEHFV
ncbi:response regulator [Erwinia sp. CPCC 100877]|nr:response regulator [Erwinia sp. CPCC 100877]